MENNQISAPLNLSPIHNAACGTSVLLMETVVTSIHCSILHYCLTLMGGNLRVTEDKVMLEKVSDSCVYLEYICSVCQT